MRQVLAAMAVVAFVGLPGLVRAEDRPNPTGTWKWSVTWGGQTREMTLTLKLDGDKLTGCRVGRDGKETPIADGTYKDGEFSFTITREREGRKMTTPPEKQTARLAVERRKKGKVVTVVRGLPAEENDLPALLGQLKAACGAGGTVKGDLLEIQGDYLERVRGLLADAGYRVRG